jgi:hypothetical protein
MTPESALAFIERHAQARGRAAELHDLTELEESWLVRSLYRGEQFVAGEQGEHSRFEGMDS